MSAGHVRQRSPGSWEVRWRADGKVCTRTIKGGKKAAQRALREALSAVDKGEHVEPSRLTVAAHVAERIAAWHAAGRITGRSREAYETSAKLLEPIGAIAVQRLGTADVERLHLGWRHLGASARRSAHGLLKRALAEAVRHKLCARNPAADQGPPPGGKRPDVSMLNAGQIAALLPKLDDQWRVPVIVALYCGLRRGEQLALRWHRVDLDGAKLHVVEALDEAAGKITVKEPKTDAGRRTISLPQIAVDALRTHYKKHLERCLLLGLGRPAGDSLVFPGSNGGYDGPRAFTRRWARAAARFGVPEATWHSLRHSHASMLIDARLPITMVSRRLGHANPSVTLNVYAHLFATDDTEAAAALDAALQ
jgi:integrase